MTNDVIVVGGGIGGLTVAALLAARGVSVCLLEREDHTGGCAANVSSGGYTFEGGAGLYSSWGPGELHERIFAELKVDLPDARLCSPAYVVRLPDTTDVAICTGADEFETNIAEAFPECAREAIAFYSKLASADSAVRSAAERWPDLRNLSTFSRLRALGNFRARNVISLKSDTLAGHLQPTSPRFRQFIDAQLRMFGQCSIDECPYLYAAVALMLPRRGMYAIGGGGSALAARLTDSIKQNGGTVRLNTPVLRLAYNSEGTPAGVDLLSGETVHAKRAIVSNLTVWDTYGKLVGRDRTPADISEQLKTLHSLGVYLLYLGIDEAAAQRLPAGHVLALTDPNETDDYFTSSAFMFAVTPVWDVRAPHDKLAVTVWTQAETEPWFTFHKNQEEIEAKDQSALETWWAKIHASLPELGSGVEVIETDTPQTFYQRTRRRLGMAGGVAPSLPFGMNPFGHQTPIPRLYAVGDTTFPGQGVAAVTHAALVLVNKLTGKT